MRDRLIQLLKKAHSEWLEKEYEHETDKNIDEYVSDYLLANGVIVPPCNVGDIVYYNYWHNGDKVGEGMVKEIYFNGDGFAYHICHEYTYFDLQQEEVFLTREEAERALKGGEGG